jgi:hypothetical protein
MARLEPTKSALSLTQLAAQTQLDFELRFFGEIIRRHHSNLDLLRLHARNLVASERIMESMSIAKKIVDLCPSDVHAHYNLACGHSLLRQPDPAFQSLRKALELGYRDFKYILEDPDLEPLREDPRFRVLLREFA